MSISSVMKNLAGTISNSFRIGLGNFSVVIRNVSGIVFFLNRDETGGAKIVVDEVRADNALIGKSVVVESATGHKTSLVYNGDSTVLLKLPINAFSAGAVLMTDNTGQMYWGSASVDTSMCIKTGTTSLAYGASDTVSLDTVPAGAQIQEISVIVDTPFNGAASLTIGLTGDQTKYVDTTMVDLKTQAQYCIEVNGDTLAADELLKAFYSQGGATAGAARIKVSWSTPQ